MNEVGLSGKELDSIRAVLARYPNVREARIFGSRAKGTARANSDVDITLWGDLSYAQLARIAADLDELPMPYLFDVQAFDLIRHPQLREHIERVGKLIYAGFERK